MRGQIKSSKRPERCKTATAMNAPLLSCIPPYQLEWLTTGLRHLLTLSPSKSVFCSQLGGMWQKKDPFPSDAGWERRGELGTCVGWVFRWHLRKQACSRHHANQWSRRMMPAIMLVQELDLHSVTLTKSRTASTPCEIFFLSFQSLSEIAYMSKQYCHLWINWQYNDSVSFSLFD